GPRSTFAVSSFAWITAGPATPRLSLNGPWRSHQPIAPSAMSAIPTWNSASVPPTLVPPHAGHAAPAPPVGNQVRRHARHCRRLLVSIEVVRATLVRLLAPSTARPAHSGAGMMTGRSPGRSRASTPSAVGDRFLAEQPASRASCLLRVNAQSPNARGYVGREVATAGPRADRAGIPLSQGAERAPQPGQAGSVGTALDALVPPPARPPPDPAAVLERAGRSRLRDQGRAADVHPGAAAAAADRRLAGGRLGRSGGGSHRLRDESERRGASALRRGASTRRSLRALEDAAAELGRHRAPGARDHEGLRAALRAVRPHRARGGAHRARAGRRHPQLEAARRQHLPSHPAAADPARLRSERARVHPHRDRNGSGAVL